MEKIKQEITVPRGGTGIGDATQEMVVTKLGFVTTPARSAMMRKIKNKNTKPETALAKALWQRGWRYRRNYTKLAGKPDLVFTKYKVVVFVDGAFWHGHDWLKRKQRLLTNLEGERQRYWIEKIERNMARDQRYTEELSAAGWQVLRFWDKEVNKQPQACVAAVEAALQERQVI
jgi:DNA mismatch endonuclease, patch repair protein